MRIFLSLASLRNGRSYLICLKEPSCKVNYIVRSYGNKGIVQRDLTWVETRLKRSVLMNYICRQVCFLNFKGTPSREEHKIGFSV